MNYDRTINPNKVTKMLNMVQSANGMNLVAIECINELQAENAELKARLDKAVELPCKVGDTVYRAGEFSGIITPGTIDRITLSKFKPTFKCESETIFYLFDEDDIGDVIFLTEAEALAKLEEMKGGVE